MALFPITAAGQWWSGGNGWRTPFPSDHPYSRNSRLSITIAGSLTNGTVIVLRRRLRAMFNDGTSAGTPVVVRQFTEEFSDDFSGVNGMYEYDIGCPTTFGAGDTVTVEII